MGRKKKEKAHKQSLLTSEKKNFKVEPAPTLDSASARRNYERAHCSQENETRLFLLDFCRQRGVFLSIERPLSESICYSNLFGYKQCHLAN